MDNILLKKDLTTDQLAMVQGEYEDKKKNPVIAYLLWFFLGGFGGHRYYLGNIGMGIAMTLTIGGLGIWSLIDVFFINGRLKEINNGLEKDVIERVKLYTRN